MYTYVYVYVSKTVQLLAVLTFTIWTENNRL